MNADTFACPYTYSFVNKDDENPVPTSIYDPTLNPHYNNLIYADVNNYLTINESVYDGTDLEFRVKVVTGFGEGVFKTVKITNKCPNQVSESLNSGETIYTLARAAGGRSNMIM